MHAFARNNASHSLDRIHTALSNLLLALEQNNDAILFLISTFNSDKILSVLVPEAI